MTLQELGGLNLEHLSELFNGIQRSRIDLPFQRGNIGPIDPCQVGQSFLRQLSFRSNSAQVQSEDLPKFHAAWLTPATTLHPRSILYTLSIGAGEAS